MDSGQVFRYLVAVLARVVAGIAMHRLADEVVGSDRVTARKIRH